MALTFRQRRRRDILIGLVIAILVIAFTMGKSIVSFLSGPAGYARHIPPGQYARLEWTQLKQVLLQKNAMLPTPAVAALDGKAVSVSGYLMPIDETPLSEQFTAHPMLLEEPVKDDQDTQLKVNSTVVVNVAGGKKLQLVGSRVTAYGTLNLGSGNGQALYVLDNAVVVR